MPHWGWSLWNQVQEMADGLDLLGQRLFSTHQSATQLRSQVDAQRGRLESAEIDIRDLEDEVRKIKAEMCSEGQSPICVSQGCKNNASKWDWTCIPLLPEGERLRPRSWNDNECRTCNQVALLKRRLDKAMKRVPQDAQIPPSAVEDSED